MTMVHPALAPAITEIFKTKNITEGLRLLGQRANGVAAGLWQVEGDSLKQRGVWFTNEMSEPVKTGFQKATENVPLSQTALAIVKAVRECKPVITHADSAPTSAGNSSPTWLRKFGAKMSLAVPVKVKDKAVGVLAISTRDAYTKNDTRYGLMTHVANGLGSVLNTVA